MSPFPTCLLSHRQAGDIRSRPGAAKRARESREPGGDGADRHVKLLIQFAVEGSLLGLFTAATPIPR